MLVQTSKCSITTITTFVTSIGAINWGLIGMLDFNLVTYLFGTQILSKVIYCLVGISGIFTIFTLYRALSPELKKAD
jgi:hypothetical protein